jgi:magnesium transporter
VPDTLAFRPAPTGACQVFAVCFDFEAKVDVVVPLTEAVTSINGGGFAWIDLLASDLNEARTILSSLDLLDPEVIDDMLQREPSTQHGRYERYLHGAVSACVVTERGFELERVDWVVSENVYLTVHRGEVGFLNRVKRQYHADFVRFAKTPSFLLYEIWDQLLESYLQVQKVMEQRVEALADLLSSGEVSDEVFARTAALGADLLHFRKVVLPARAVLADLSTRRSHLLSEATQAFLANMAGTVEHVLQDVIVDRDILSEALNLNMSLIGHRTNQVMRRLTVVSLLFLPLTFLAGVYGMNFRILPELDWQYGYLYFWGMAVAMVLGVLFLLKKGRML